MAKIFSIVLGIVFAISGIALLHPGRTIINFTKHTLRREILFLGHYPLWHKDFSFGEFNAIVVNQRIGGDRNNCFIGLSRLSGRKFGLNILKIRQMDLQVLKLKNLPGNFPEISNCR